MRAVGISGFGDPDVLETFLVDAAAPGQGQVRVRTTYAGVNRIDVHVRQGRFLGSKSATPTWPLVLGYEGSGEIEALGPGVSEHAIGDRVAWSGVRGAHADCAIVPAWRLVPIPKTMPMDVACALQYDGLLAHALCVSVFPLQRDDIVLITAGADSVSQLLIQIAKAQGAMVIALVERDADKGAPIASGADHVLVRAGGDLDGRIGEITKGQGCHVVFDGLGKSMWDTALAVCRKRGVVVLVDANNGPVETIRPEALAAAGSVFLARPHLADFCQDSNEIRWRMDGIFNAWESGQLKVTIGRVLPLEGAREGHLALEAPTPAGKILLRLHDEPRIATTP